MDIKEFRRQLLFSALQNPACIEETIGGQIITEKAIRVVSDISRRIGSTEGGWEFFGIDFDKE
jgi:hypothetical protein